MDVQYKILRSVRKKYDRKRLPTIQRSSIEKEMFVNRFADTIRNRKMETRYKLSFPTLSVWPVNRWYLKI